MSPATTHPAPAAATPSLDDQVDTLLRDLDQACAKVESGVSDDPPKDAPTPEIAGDAVIGDVGVKDQPAPAAEPQSDEPLATPEAADQSHTTAIPDAATPAAAPVAEATEPAAAAPEAPKPAEPASLDASVNQLLDQMGEAPKEAPKDPAAPAAAAQPAPPTPAPAATSAPAAEAAPTSESDSLASLTESLLGPEVVGTPAEEPAAAAKPEAHESEHATSPAATASTPPPPTKPDPTKPVKAPEPAAAHAPAKIEHAAAITTPKPSFSAKARAALAVATHKLEPTLAKALAPASKPLASKPKVVRDTVGWMAVYTLFVAGTFWAYLIFFYKAPKPAVAEPGVHLAGKGEPEGAAGEVKRTATGTEGGGESAEGGEGEHAPAKAEHGEAKAEAKGGEHGGGEHGGGGAEAKKDMKPKPLPSIANKLSAKKGDKKPAPKSEGEGHGESHGE